MDRLVQSHEMLGESFGSGAPGQHLRIFWRRELLWQWKKKGKIWRETMKNIGKYLRKIEKIYGKSEWEMLMENKFRTSSVEVDGKIINSMGEKLSKNATFDDTGDDSNWINFLGLYSDLMGFYSGLMGFYSDSMGY